MLEVRQGASSARCCRTTLSSGGSGGDRSLMSVCLCVFLCAYVYVRLCLCIQLHMFRPSENLSYIDNRIVRRIWHLPKPGLVTCCKISSVTGCGLSHLRATVACLSCNFVYMFCAWSHASENAGVCLTANCGIVWLCLGGSGLCPSETLENASRHLVATQSPLSRHYSRH